MPQLAISHTTGTAPEMTYNEWIIYILKQIQNDNTNQQ
jgi:hypothetical protein